MFMHLYLRPLLSIIMAPLTAHLSPSVLAPSPPFLDAFPFSGCAAFPPPQAGVCERSLIQRVQRSPTQGPFITTSPAACPRWHVRPAGRAGGEFGACHCWEFPNPSPLPWKYRSCCFESWVQQELGGDLDNIYTSRSGGVTLTLARLTQLNIIRVGIGMIITK